MKCPICDATKFGDFRGRRLARCQGCGSFERSRLLWLILRDLPLNSGEHAFLHFAPEIGIAKRLAERLGPRYRAFDFHPEIYLKAGIDAQPFDLCVDTQTLPKCSVAAVCHVHVLEHVRCNAADVLRKLNELLIIGGYHVFGIPFFSQHYREDLSPELTADERLARFGHEDHMRSFGTRDFETMFGPALEGMERVDVASRIGAAELTTANIPSRALAALGTHTIFVYRKIGTN